MSSVDVLVVFDPQWLLSQNPGTSEGSPAVLGNNPAGVFMLTTLSHAQTGEAGAELNVKARVGDTIRWREASLSPMDYSVMFYNFIVDEGNDLIAPIVPHDTSPVVPFPNGINGQGVLPPRMQSVDDYFWQCTASHAGSVTYHFSFALFDRDGNALGYYTYDPYITITP